MSKKGHEKLAVYYDLEGREGLDDNTLRFSVAQDLLNETGNTEKSKNWYQEFLENFSQYGRTICQPEHEKVFLQLIREYANQGDFNRAIYLCSVLESRLSEERVDIGKLLQGQCQLANGNATVAIEHLAACQIEKLPRSLQDEYWIVRSKVARFNQRWDESLDFITFVSDQALQDWEKLNIDYIADKDLVPHINAVKKGGKYYSTQPKLEVWLRMFACLKHKYQHKIQSPKNIKRILFFGNEESAQSSLLLKICERLEKLENSQLSADYHELMGIFSSIKKLLDVELQFLCLFATTIILEKLNVTDLATLAKNRYRTLALQMNTEVSFDPLLVDINESSMTLARMNNSTFEQEYQREINMADRLKFSSKMLFSAAEYKMKSVFSTHHKIENLKKQAIVNIAEAIAANSVELGPAFQKMMQIGLGIAESLPEEIKEKIADSQYTAKILRANEVVDIVKGKLGDRFSDNFQSFDVEPVAAGSIGQVHRGVLKDGKVVAIKVRYPHIVKMLTEDISAFMKIHKFVNFIFPNQDVRSLALRTKKSMLEECDLIQELNTHEYAHNLYANDPYIKVPKCYPEYSNEKFITTDYINGRSLKEVIENEDQDTRNHVGLQIFRSVFLGLKSGFFPCDIHEGNFLIYGDYVYRLDFGITVHQEDLKDFDILQVIHCAVECDVEGLQSFLANAGYTAGDKENLKDFAEEVIYKNLKCFSSDRSFRFTPDFAREVFQSQIKNFIGPDALIFPPSHYQVTRVYWSLFTILGKLHAEADWKKEWQKLYELDAVA